MKNIINLLFLAFFLSLTACHGSKKANKPSSESSVEVEEIKGVRFVTSGQLQPLLDRAKAEKKLVFLDFYTNWCLPCRIMDEEVFSLSQTGDYMNENFISYKVNAEKDNGPQLSTIFSVYAYPTLLFLDAEGNILERKDGSLSYSKFMALAEKAMGHGM